MGNNARTSNDKRSRLMSDAGIDPGHIPPEETG